MVKTLEDALAKLAKTAGHRDPTTIAERDLPVLPLLHEHEWIEKEGEPPYDVCYGCGQRRD